MTEPDPMPTFDELLSHSRWVRKLAREIIRDEHRADDVVQATWMAALRRPPTDGSNVRGWLATVVRNLAHEIGRSEERRTRRERCSARPEAIASTEDAAERAQLQRDLVDHVLRLEEPYRSVLLLRYFEDLPPRKIAARLGVPVATVRSRHARGLERLRTALTREKGDRADWFESLAVLAFANKSSTAIGACAEIGRALVKKKFIVAAAALLVALLTFVWMHLPSDDATPTARHDASKTAQAITPATPPAGGLETAGATVEQVREPAAVVSAGSHSLRGRVLDAGTDDPIAGAEVSLFAPKHGRLRDFAPDSLALVQVQADGSLYPRAHPVLPAVRSDLQLAGVEEIEMLDMPDADATPIAHTQSGPDGGFTLTSTREDGFLIVHAVGFGDRRQAWSRAAPGAEEAARDVYMARSKPLRGRVLDDEGKPFLHRVRFGSYYHVKAVFITDRDKSEPLLHDDAWLLETKDDGTFEWEFAAQIAFIFSAQPDLVVLEYGPLAPDGHGCLQEPWLNPGKEPGDVAIVVRGVSVLVVSDATTGAPIERFRLKTRQIGNQSTVRRDWDGWFQAPGGEKQLVMPDIGEPRRMMESGHVKEECTVWAPGHVPKTLTVEDPWKAQRIEARLERGADTQVTGRVTRAGVAVANSPVTLFSILDRQHWRWYPPTRGLSWMPFASVRSDSDGLFALDVLPGCYLAKVGDPEEYVLATSNAPGEALAIDLAQHADLLVRVHALSGAAVENCKLELTRPDGGRWESETDARGEALCTAASPGVDTLRAGRVSIGNRDDSDVTSKVDVHPGMDNAIDITLPEDKPKYAKLIVDGPGAITDWRAHKTGWGDDSSVDVEPSGRIPIDLRSASGLTLSCKTGQRRIVSLPDDAADGFEIHIRMDGPGYDGVLTSPSNTRIAGIWVVASEKDKYTPGEVQCVAITDHEGRFHLTGLRDVQHQLVFLANESGSANSDFSSMTVVPKSKPATPPVRLSIDLPARRGDGFAGVDVTSVSGHATFAGPAPDKVWLTLRAVFDRPDHEFTIAQQVKLGPDGAYALTVARAPRYRASYWIPGPQKYPEPLEWSASGGDHEVHDIVFP